MIDPGSNVHFYHAVENTIYPGVIVEIPTDMMDATIHAVWFEHAAYGGLLYYCREAQIIPNDLASKEIA